MLDFSDSRVGIGIRFFTVPLPNAYGTPNTRLQHGDIERVAKTNTTEKKPPSIKTPSFDTAADEG